MGDLTADGSGSGPPPSAADSARATAKAGTKSTKRTKITRTTWMFVIFVAFVNFVPERAAWPVSAAAQQQPPTEAQQRPVFRGGTHFVRVDAYPIEDGKIVEGLTPQDFEIREDGKPQTVESFDFITFDTFTPEAVRHEPQSQREGFDLAADPRNRVFVIFVDMVAAGKVAVRDIQRPLANFLDRIVSASDLFALLTSRNTAKDLVL